METIKIPHTDLEVSRLALGCMGLGGGWEANVPLTKDHERQAREFLDTAEEIGANFFDHANIYGRGRAEEIFGRVLKERPSLRDKIVIQSKCGIRWADDPPGTPQRFDFSRDHILESVDAILARLGTDHLEILLLHRPDPLWEGEEIAEAFQKLHLAGKVRYFGVSNQGRFQMEYLQSFLPEPLVANQVEMNRSAPWLRRAQRFVQPEFAPLPRRLGGNDGVLPVEACSAPSLESPGPRCLDREFGWSARKHPEDGRPGAGICPDSRNYAGGHPAGVAAQTSGEDPARVGNDAPRPIAVLRQISFRFSEPRRMVLPFCRGPGSIHALKTRKVDQRGN